MLKSLRCRSSGRSKSKSKSSLDLNKYADNVSANSAANNDAVSNHDNSNEGQVQVSEIERKRCVSPK